MRSRFQQPDDYQPSSLDRDQRIQDSLKPLERSKYQEDQYEDEERRDEE